MCVCERQIPVRVRKFRDKEVFHNWSFPHYSLTCCASAEESLVIPLRGPSRNPTVTCGSARALTEADGGCRWGREWTFRNDDARYLKFHEEALGTK